MIATCEVTISKLERSEIRELGGYHFVFHGRGGSDVGNTLKISTMYFSQNSCYRGRLVENEDYSADVMISLKTLMILLT